MTRKLLLETAHRTGDCLVCRRAAELTLIADVSRVWNETISHRTKVDDDHWAAWRVVPEEDA